MKRLIFLFFLAFCFTKNLAQVEVQATLSQNRLFIGDKTTLNLQIAYTNDCELIAIIPDTLKHFGLEFTMPKNESYWQSHTNTNNGTIYKTSLVLQSFTPDTFEIPPIPVVFAQNSRRDTAFSLPISLFVFPMAIDSAEILEPIADIIEEPRNFSDFLPQIMIGLLILLAFATVFYFYQKQKNKKTKNDTIESLTPIQKAIAELEKIETQGFIEKRETIPFATATSHVLRTFLETFYSIKSLENTTSNIIQLIDFQNITKETKQNWSTILQDLDLIKFGKAMPDENDLIKLLNQSKTIVVNSQKQEND